MRRIYYFFAAFCLFTATSCSDTPDNGSIRAGSYNLWRSDLGKDEYAWEHRKNLLAQSIADANFDIFGVQEADTRIQEELPELVRQHTGKYAWWFFSPYSQDGHGDKAQGIVYDSTRFTMKESHKFWLSETPDTPSSAWDEKPKFKRGACCFIFNDMKTGKDFFAMVIHGPLAKEANANSAKVVMEKFKEYNPDGLPAFFVGDFNARPGDPASVLYREYWTDAFSAVGDADRKGSRGTFNGHDVGKDMEKARRIDYIYFNGGIKAVGYECINTQYDGIWPSDHCPVCATLVLP